MKGAGRLGKSKARVELPQPSLSRVSESNEAGTTRES